MDHACSAASNVRYMTVTIGGDVLFGQEPARTSSRDFLPAGGERVGDLLHCIHDIWFQFDDHAAMISQIRNTPDNAELL